MREYTHTHKRMNANVFKHTTKAQMCLCEQSKPRNEDDDLCAVL